MAVNMSIFYATLIRGVDDPTSQIPIQENRTSELKVLLKGLDRHSQATACLLALIRRYPEPELLGICLHEFLASQPKSMGSAYHLWRKEIDYLSRFLRGKPWEEVFRHQTKMTHPKVARNLWPQPVESRSANP